MRASGGAGLGRRRCGNGRGFRRGGRWRRGSGRDLDEAGHQRAQVGQPPVHLRIVEQREQFAEARRRFDEMLPVVGPFRVRVAGGRQVGQQALAHIGERRSDARRRFRLARLVERIDANDGGNGRLRLVGAAEREQAQRPILLDRLAIARRRDVRAGSGH